MRVLSNEDSPCDADIHTLSDNQSNSANRYNHTELRIEHKTTKFHPVGTAGPKRPPDLASNHTTSKWITVRIGDWTHTKRRYHLSLQCLNLGIPILRVIDYLIRFPPCNCIWLIVTFLDFCSCIIVIIQASRTGVEYGLRWWMEWMTETDTVWIDGNVE